MTGNLEAPLSGKEISQALDPDWRASVSDALAQELGRRSAPRVALVGFQAATYFEEVAARASSVVIVEPRQSVVENLRRAVVSQELGKKVSIVVGDPETVKLEEAVDVAVYLPRSVWMMEGPDAAVLAHLRSTLKTGGALIPGRIVQLLELANATTHLSGISLRQPRYSLAGEPVATLSESKHFLTTRFDGGQGSGPAVDDTIIVRPVVSGVVSALRLTSVVELVPGAIQISSESGLRSILVPLREDIDVEAGKPVSIRVRYEPGKGLHSARFSARQLTEEDEPPDLPEEHAVIRGFQDRLTELMAQVDSIGRGSDLDRVVAYTRRPHGDVTRLTALFWAVDEEFRRPLREIVEAFRRKASEELGQTPTDEAVYELMIQVYEKGRSS